MRLNHLVYQVWLRLVKLIYKPPLVFIMKTWSVKFFNRGGQDVCDNLLPVV